MATKDEKITKTLSEAQRRVMKWLGNGWESEPGAGMSIHVNGKRICNIDSLHALERMGLVEQKLTQGRKAVGEWKSTEAGRQLTAQLCL